jgi:hypothetical protein
MNEWGIWIEFSYKPKPQLKVFLGFEEWGSSGFHIQLHQI